MDTTDPDVDGAMPPSSSPSEHQQQKKRRLEKDEDDDVVIFDRGKPLPYFAAVWSHWPARDN